MKIFTTINPWGNFESQNEAMLSWSKYYQVYSVNPLDEIDMAMEKFPFINFIGTDDIFTYREKKLVKLNAILDSIKKEKCKYCAIVNSDIILKNKIDVKYLKSDLTIATRWELDGVNKPYPFNNGYDFFAFKSDIIDIFYNPNYVIGMPWWDFWMPLITTKLGFTISHIKNSVIFHRTHETNYDGDIWIRFGEYLYKDVIVNLMKRQIDVDIWTFCVIVKKFIESRQNNIKIK
jgi:hypothetical protein